MIDRRIEKGQLRNAVGISYNTMVKLEKNENVALSVLLSICEYLRCDFGDIIEAVPEEKSSPYYMAYENRYQKVFAAGEACWGHSPSDDALIQALSHWVADNQLKGKKIIEYACGEGSCGIILSKLSCIYHGVDIAPSAVERASLALAGFPSASVSRLDMVNECVNGPYDAALDIMGFHMLVTDDDRHKYLVNVNGSLKSGAPALFFRESYRNDAYSGPVASFDEWKRISGLDYEIPEPRKVGQSDIVVNIPLVPARAKNKADYIAEMEAADFVVDEFIEMDINMHCSCSASIYVHKK